MPITKAILTDTVELTKLVNSAYRGESSQKGWTTEAHLLDGIRIDEPTMAGYLQADDDIVLKYTNNEGQIIACVYLQQQKQKLYLGMLTVSPTLQANGIGRQLLHEAEKIAHNLNCSMIFMTVITTRHELINWYERRGYLRTEKIEPFASIPKRFGEPKEEIEMVVLEKEI